MRSETPGRRKVSANLKKRSVCFVESYFVSEAIHVRAFGHKFPFQIPAIDTAITSIPRPCHDIVVLRRLLADHLRYELGVMAEIGVHDNYEVTSSELD